MGHGELWPYAHSVYAVRRLHHRYIPPFVAIRPLLCRFHGVLDCHLGACTGGQCQTPTPASPRGHALQCCYAALLIACFSLPSPSIGRLPLLSTGIYSRLYMVLLLPCLCMLSLLISASHLPVVMAFMFDLNEAWIQDSEDSFVPVHSSTCPLLLHLQAAHPYYLMWPAVPWSTSQAKLCPIPC